MGGLLSVSIGTAAWATIAFLLVAFILKKMAWGPILKSLEERSLGIENALNEAEKARLEMTKLQAGNEQLLREARDERDKILAEAKALKDSIVSEARNKASEESTRLITAARLEIENQKKAAITELKNQVAVLSVDIAEKLTREKLSDGEKQKALNESLIAEIRSN
ncbi:MAG: F0F1 ATP synthase subunit B [Flavobacteriales bacterium]|nr:F0F1 ATP synthase subunit B [Flavobacteriales bacterium]